MTVERDRGALDALVRDACEQQAVHGVMPTPEPVRRELAPFLSDLDARTAARKPKPSTAASTGKREGAIADEYRRRTGRTLNPGEYGIERRAPGQGQLAAPVKRAEGEWMVIRRLRLLKRYPDWAARIKGVNPMAAAGNLGPDKKREAESLYKSILKESERVFGPIFFKRAPKAFSTTPSSSTPK